LDKDLKDIITHLRFPFSILLLPIFLFSILQSDHVQLFPAMLLFFLLHLLVYPSSNGFNSLMDDDKGSIGGVKHPPKVPTHMMYVTIFMDILSITVSYVYFNMQVVILLISYILASRAYSHRRIRLKKYPVIGFLTVSIFQGPVIYLLTRSALSASMDMSVKTLLSIGISFMLIGAGYPLSQVYQHEQDKADGVYTLSMLLGIKGTFVFSGIMFFIQAILLGIYFIIFQHDWNSFYLLILCLAPVIIQFNSWMINVFKDEAFANYDNTMKTNTIGALAINLFFILITIKYIF
jgi:4-hydroxybenzoate polyprenyltransferase